MKRKICFLAIFLVFSFCTLTSCKKNNQVCTSHTYAAATCTAPKTCTKCGYTEGEPLGHDLVHHEKVEANCTTSGHNAYDTCSRCDYTTFKEIPALGHDWLYDDTYHVNICDRCNTCDGIKYVLNINYLEIGQQTYIDFKDYEPSDFEFIIYDEDIISIDNYGRIQALAVGNTDVEAYLISDPNYFIEFNFKVIDKAPTVYTTYERMAKDDISYLYFKDSLESVSDYTITFGSDKILEVASDNSIKAIGYGTETVTLTSKKDPRIVTSCKITIVNAKTNLVIYGANPNGSMKARETMQLTNTLSSNNRNLTWVSTNSKVAVVSEGGVVTAVSEGYVSIYAYPNNDKQNVVHYYLNVSGIGEADYISRFIHVALEENGTHETGDNIQKYGEWYPNNGAPWCAMFVSWCWYQAGLTNDILCKYQGCYTGMKWCTEKGIMHFVQDYTFTEALESGVSSKQYAENYKPVTGDIIFFLSSGMSHTGIAIYADDKYLYTIEGNTSDQVAIKRWSLNDARITGYAHPKYPEYSKEREDFSWIKDQKADGTYWWTEVAEKQKVD